MNTAVKAGVVLAIVVAILSVLFALAGLHKNPMAGGLGFIAVAIVINLALVFWALKRTAAESPYGRQLLSGLVIGAVGGALIFLFSLLLVSVIFPDYMAETREGAAAFFERAGLPEEQIEMQMARMEQATPVSQALSGTIGTFFTSLIGAAIIGIFLRKK